MKDHAIEEVACRLEARGQDPGKLRELQVELDCLERPPGFLKRTSTRISAMAKTQWAHLMGELEESGEAFTLMTRAVSSREKLTGAEADTVREQMFDLLRVVPASLLAVANAVLPIPGTSMATPWLLQRLGIMPSRWREAHLLDALEAERARLQDAGLSSEANAIEDIVQEIEAEADAREQLARDAVTLTFWDLNQNGEWDETEREAYRAAVDLTAERLGDSAQKKRWFLLHEASVIGPIRMDAIDDSEVDPKLLVCWEGTSGWVSLHDVLERSAQD